LKPPSGGFFVGATLHRRCRFMHFSDLARPQLLEDKRTLKKPPPVLRTATALTPGMIRSPQLFCPSIVNKRLALPGAIAATYAKNKIGTLNRVVG
jgi:hypothetical protein